MKKKTRTYDLTQTVPACKFFDFHDDSIDHDRVVKMANKETMCCVFSTNSRKMPCFLHKLGKNSKARHYIALYLSQSKKETDLYKKKLGAWWNNPTKEEWYAPAGIKL